MRLTLLEECQKYWEERIKATECACSPGATMTGPTGCLRPTDDCTYRSPE
jgi:hypothetical protein